MAIVTAVLWSGATRHDNTRPRQGKNEKFWCSSTTVTNYHRHAIHCCCSLLYWWWTMWWKAPLLGDPPCIHSRAEGATCKTTTTTQALLLGDQPTNRSWEIILLIIPRHPSDEEGLKQSQLLIQHIGKYYVQSPESVHPVVMYSK